MLIFFLIVPGTSLSQFTQSTLEKVMLIASKYCLPEYSLSRTHNKNSEYGKRLHVEFKKTKKLKKNKEYSGGVF